MATEKPVMTGEEKKAVAEKLLAAWQEVVRSSFENFSSGYMYDVFDGLWLYAYCVERDISESFAVRMCKDAKLTFEQIKKLLPDAATEFMKHAPGAVATAINELGTVCVTEIAINPVGGGKYMMALEVTAPDAIDLNERVRAKLTLNRGIVERRLMDKGRLSQWRKDDLEPIIRRTLELLPKPRRTYNNAVSVLKGIYGDNAPDSGEALRKTLERAGIDWKRLKADIS
ncbi:MAG: hypothetical protein LC778_14585 [Acidobacteria bacterium]|nr:hypothetical protein [Acidobacteriota bacterium]